MKCNFNYVSSYSCPVQDEIYTNTDAEIYPPKDEIDDDSIHNDWNIGKLYDSKFDINELVDMLPIIDRFKQKYPNDEYVFAFDEIVRQEICSMLGGELVYDE